MIFETATGAMVVLHASMPPIFIPNGQLDSRKVDSYTLKKLLLQIKRGLQNSKDFVFYQVNLQS